MSLIVPKGPSFAYTQNNYGTVTGANAPGTLITTGANNTNGTAASLMTLTQDCEYLILGFQGFFITGNNNSCLAEILVDPAGGTSWSVLIPDLLVGANIQSAAGAPQPLYFFFPIWIKSGSAIGIRARTAHTANITTSRVLAIARGANANPGSWWCGQSVTAIAVINTTGAGDFSRGQSHTAGNSAAYSSWTNLGSTLGAACGALQWRVQGTFTNTGTNALVYQWQIGVGADVIDHISVSTNTTETSWSLPPGLIQRSLPSGAQLQIRGACSGTAQAMDVAAWAVH